MLTIFFILIFVGKSGQNRCKQIFKCELNLRIKLLGINIRRNSNILNKPYYIADNVILICNFVIV